MRFRVQAALLFVLMLVCGFAQQTATAQGNNVQLVIEGKVVRVSDGDTITVLDADNKQHRIRFQGIDAPESKQAFGQVSKENLSKMVFGKQVTVYWSKVDKYRRTVGKVMVDGRDINIEQLKAGLAWHYKKYANEQPPEDQISYAKAEEEARAARRGLWSDPNPTNPSDWRVDAKEERWGPPPPAGTIIGNKSSKKYHRPDCPGYKDMAERNRVFFKSVEEAEAAGYKRAGNCTPEVAVSTASATRVAASTQESPQTEKKESTKTTKPTTATTTTATTATTTGATTSAGDIVGNKNSKIYHAPGCPGYNSVSEKNRVYFKTAEEAEAAGYKRAGNCKSGASTTAATSTPTPSSNSSKASKTATPSTTATGAEQPASTSSATSTGGEIIGNKNSKIYHRPNCPGYNSVSEKNQVRFSSVEEAEKAGYRAAKNCPAQ